MRSHRSLRAVLGTLFGVLVLSLSVCGVLKVELTPGTGDARTATTGAVTPTADVPTVTPGPETMAPAPTAAPPGEIRYLGVNQVRGVLFTAADTVWAATTGGAVRWSLRTGSHEQFTRADGLAANWVNDVAEAPDGSLWFATLGGVSRFDGEIWINYTEADGLADDTVQAIAVTEEGTVWAGTTEGVGQFDGESWATHFPGDRAWQIAVGPEGAVWIAADAAGLRRYDPAENAWTTFEMEDDPFTPGVKTVAVAPDGSAWVYLGYDQVYRFDGQHWEPAYDAGGQWVCGAAFQADGTPWIATCSGYHASGAGLATREEGSWQHVGPTQGLASQEIQAVTIGPEGEIAAGTDRGLSVYREGTWQTLRHGPMLNRITTAAVTPDGVTWFGFGTTSSRPEGGGITRFDGQTWETFSQASGLPISDAVRFLEVAPDGTLWAAGGCGVAYRADGTWHQVAGCDDLQGNVVGLAFASDGALWIAASFNVLRVDEEGVKSWENLTPISIVATPEGTVLIGQSPLGEGGVWTFDGNDWRSVADGPECVAQMVSGGAETVWTIACEGDRLIRRRGSAWEEVTTDDGLPPGRIADITIGPSGELWMAAEGGIGRLAPEGWIVHERSWEGSVSAIAVAPDGSVWLATSRGAVHILSP